jgi:N-acetylmuramic acid 6-phosphate (MurNAc-6-P) etherase
MRRLLNLHSKIVLRIGICILLRCSRLTIHSVVAVAGAGRGPLVDRALKAAQSAGRQIEIFAVEKNPHAFVG